MQQYFNGHNHAQNFVLVIITLKSRLSFLAGGSIILAATKSGSIHEI